MASHLVKPTYKCQRLYIILTYYSIGSECPCSLEDFRVMGATNMGNLDKIVILMAKVRHTYLSSILY